MSKKTRKGERGGPGARPDVAAWRRCGVGGGGIGLLGVWSSHASHDAHTLIYRGINKDPVGLLSKNFLPSSKVVCRMYDLRKISQNYNIFILSRSIYLLHFYHGGPFIRESAYLSKDVCLFNLQAEK